MVVLGSGIDVPYPPSHAPLFDQVVERGGAVVSEFPPGSEPSSWSFPTRNLTISLLSDACIVVEAGARSGALYTARFSCELGRRVMVCLGSAGCDALAAQGAAAGRSAADLLNLVEGGRPAAVQVSDPEGARLFQALDGEARELGEVAKRAGIDVAQAMSLAVDLEMQGLVVRAPGGRYLRLT